MRKIIAVLTVALGTATGSHGVETEATIRAYAAGYKASFTCSATFNGGKTPDQIAAQELKGIYPLVADIVPTLEAIIDTESKRVSVAFSDTLPPRISQWRPHLGCTQLPVGATFSDADNVPKIKLPLTKRDHTLPWRQIPDQYGSSKNKALAAIAAEAFNNPKYGKDAFTTAILVATPDDLLVERYLPGYTHRTSQRTWSVAKSIAASVIGAAVEKGLLDVKAPAPIQSWQSPLDPRKAITVENLLHMASGLDSNVAGNRTDRLYIGGGRLEDTAMRAALEAAPGSRWKYANNDTLLAVRALRDAIGEEQTYLEFPFKALLHKIGMYDTVPEVDWGGNFVMSSQVWTTSRDLARLGILYLNDGIWNGERILPEGWARYVATPAPQQPPKARADVSAIPGYGAQFWLYNERFPDVPNDAFAARGNRGQILMIIPSRNLVIVRRGHDPAGGEGFKIHTFAKDVLSSLDKNS